MLRSLALILSLLLTPAALAQSADDVAANCESACKKDPVFGVIGVQ
jgi:hypothetical protein